MFDWTNAITAVASSAVTIGAGLPIVKKLIAGGKVEIPKAEHIAEAVFVRVKSALDLAKPIVEAVESVPAVKNETSHLEKALQHSELTRVAGTVLQALGKGYSDLNQFEQVALTSFVQAQVPGAAAADVVDAVKEVEATIQQFAKEPIFEYAQTFAKTLADLAAPKEETPAVQTFTQN